MAIIKRYALKLMTLMLVASLFSVFGFEIAKKAEAYSTNNLISDAEFISSNTLDADGVQAFLNSRSGTRLRTFRENGLTAAQIINNAAKINGINPFVILATIQKEESIIDSDINFDQRVRFAMGYGICDSCSLDDPTVQKYAGFTNQVYNAAWQFKFNYNVYAVNGSAWNVGKTMIIDNTAVTFANRATSSLYRYTPHLHGNLNFGRIYESYRGYRPPATYGDKFIVKVGPTYLRPGQRATYYAYFQNTGTAVWYKTGVNATHLGTSSPQDRYSELFGGNVRWTMLQPAIGRNMVGVFSITITAPQKTGTYTERFRPVMEGVQWLPGDEVTFNVQVGGTPVIGGGPIDKLALINQKKGVQSASASEYNAAWVAQVGGGNLIKGQKQTLYVYLKNTGSTVWTKTGSNPTVIGNSSPHDRGSVFEGGSNQRWQMLQQVIYPNQVGIFSITVTAPNQAGSYTEKFQPLVEGKTWMGPEITYTFNVR